MKTKTPVLLILTWILLMTTAPAPAQTTCVELTRYTSRGGWQPGLPAGDIDTALVQLATLISPAPVYAGSVVTQPHKQPCPPMVTHLLQVRTAPGAGLQHRWLYVYRTYGLSAGPTEAAHHEN